MVHYMVIILYFKEKFKLPIMWLRDTGILHRVKDDIMTPPIPIPDPKLRHNQPLILSQLSMIMVTLVVGLVIGTTAFVVELIKNMANIRIGREILVREEIEPNRPIFNLLQEM